MSLFHHAGFHLSQVDGRPCSNTTAATTRWILTRADGLFPTFPYSFSFVIPIYRFPPSSSTFPARDPIGQGRLLHSTQHFVSRRPSSAWLLRSDILREKEIEMWDEMRWNETECWRGSKQVRYNAYLQRRISKVLLSSGRIRRICLHLVANSMSTKVKLYCLSAMALLKVGIIQALMLFSLFATELLFSSWQIWNLGFASIEVIRPLVQVFQHTYIITGCPPKRLCVFGNNNAYIGETRVKGGSIITSNGISYFARRK
jgi:hypothetical protein